MKLEKIVLILSGFAIIAAFFLPYLTLEVKPTILGQEIPLENAQAQIQVSGFSMTQTVLNKTDVIKEGVDNGWADWLWNSWKENASENAQLKVAGLLFLLAGPFIFLIYALGYIIRGLAGKQYKHGVFTNLLYLAASWAICKFLLDLNFFSMAGLGYWVAFGGMMAAAFSLFFERGVKKAK